VRRLFRIASRLVILAICWPAMSHAADNTASRQETFVVELRINSAASSTDFYDVMRDADGRVFVPAASIFETGEATSAVDRGILRLEVMSTQQSMVVDPSAKTLTVNGKSRPLTLDDFMVGDQVLLINKTLLEETFDLDITLSEEAQRLSVATRRPWPIDLRIARERRWGRMGNQQDEESVTSVDVRQDYSVWGSPQADVAVTQAGSTVNHSALIVGEMGYLTTQIFAAGSNGKLESSRVQAGRTDPEGRAFGIPGLYDLQAGDVQSLRLPLVGSAPAGRGITFSGQPMDRPVNFDTTVIEGDALPGWDAELMLGQSIVDFMRVGPNGRYRFTNIPLGYGTNILRVVLNGPQGQTRERVFRQTVGGDMVPVGKLYTRGFVLQHKLAPGLRSGNGSAQPAPYSGALAVDYGLSKALTTGFFVAQVPDALERGGAYGGFSLRSAVEGMSVGMSLTGQQDPAARGSTQATQWVMAGALSDLSLSFSHDRFGEGFHSAANQSGLLSSLTKLRLAMPFSFPTLAPANPGSAAPAMAYAGISLDQTVQKDGSRVVTPSLQLSHGAGDWSVTHMLNYNMAKANSSTEAVGEGGATGQSDGTYRLLGSHTTGMFSIRGSIERRMAPSPEWKSITASVSYRSGIDSWSSEINYAAAAPGYSTSWSRDLGWAFLSVGGSWSKSTGFSVGTSLNFTLSGTGRGSVEMSSRYKAMQGQADVKVYNQSFGAAHDTTRGEVISAAQLSINRLNNGHQTDAQGQAKFLGLSTTESTLLSIDRDSLPDNFLVPIRPLIRFWPRAGQSIHLEIPVAESGEISGRLALDARQGLAGILLQAVDEQGTLHSETRSLNDGYFMFDTVYSGRWTVRLAPDQKWRSKRLSGAPVSVTLTPSGLRVDNVELNVNAAP